MDFASPPDVEALRRRVAGLERDTFCVGTHSEPGRCNGVNGDLR